jgi:hypothetical protein
VLVLSFHSSYLRHSDDLSCKTQNGATVIGASIIAVDAMNIEIAQASGISKVRISFSASACLERAGITEQTAFTLFYYTNQSSECGLQD